MVAPNCGSGAAVIDVGAVGKRGAFVDTGDDGEGDERGLGENDDDTDDDEKDGDMVHKDVGGELGAPLSWALGGAGGGATSSPSTMSSSVDGKKFLNKASACHLLAFLNSTQTSIRPGRERAGSRRSR